MTTLRLQGRDLRESDIAFIRQLIADHPHWHRRRLSIELCEAWNWRNGRGLLKDMAGRSLMLKLHERGIIVLPPRRRAPPNRMKDTRIEAVPHDTTPIRDQLIHLQPLKVCLLPPKDSRQALFAHLLARYHYLSFTSTVGENLKYLILDRQNRVVACLLFGSSAWSCQSRDEHIGWDRDTRAQRLPWTTNNTRFLILPWVEVHCLASHILGLVTQRLSRDWQARYGHSIYLVETYVPNTRRGTCYQAANWRHVGHTQGRSRNDRHHQQAVEVKSVYLYPLVKRYRQRLTHDDNPGA